MKARVSVEEASDFGWTKYTGTDGHNICIETFGASAPIKQLLKKFGFSAENIVAAAKTQIARHGGNREGGADQGGLDIKNEVVNRRQART